VSAIPHAIIVGPGRVGLSLGYAMVRHDAVSALTVCGRRPEPPSHPLFVQGLARYEFGLMRPDPDTAAVFLAVPDHVLPELAHALAGHGKAPEGCVAFHLSGALSTDVLAPLNAQSYGVGALHPLQAIAHPVSGADRIPGSYLAVTGGPEAVAVARRIAAALDSPILTVPAARRPAYHAAAVMASNFLPPLVDAACRILERAGIPFDEGLPALAPLIRGTLDNIEEHGIAESLTGPITRGDADTVALHLRALEGSDRVLYSVLGREVARLAAGRAPEGALQEILDLLDAEGK
jgi:predicted short-subunit dehydrogenase-like oxidoreductase (DUF2520 family)